MVVNAKRLSFDRMEGRRKPHKNETLRAALNHFAAGKGLTLVQLAIAWALAHRESIVPMLGMRTVAQMTESRGAVSVRFTPEELSALKAMVPATKSRAPGTTSRP